MCGGNLIPGSDDWQQHAQDELSGPHSILPYYSYEFGLGGSGIPTPDQFTNANQLVLAQQSAGGYGYPENQSFVWVAQSSQHGEPAQPFAQPQTEADPGNMAAIHDGLPPEIPTSLEASPSYEIVPVKSSKEKNRVAAAKCRQRAKEGNKGVVSQRGHTGKRESGIEGYQGRIRGGEAGIDTGRIQPPSM
ncbi:hypothetical protein PG991_014941 [Apiospora marii]|uniref:BZIP domain-containing protein n=1 Tax=Apiospora marii TaxID=335849 RepID=A0ABR1R3H8_9PEZI